MWRIIFWILNAVSFCFVESVNVIFALLRAMYPLNESLAEAGWFKEGWPTDGELTLIKEERMHTVTRNGITLGTCLQCEPSD